MYILPHVSTYNAVHIRDIVRHNIGVNIGIMLHSARSRINVLIPWDEEYCAGLKVHPLWKIFPNQWSEDYMAGKQNGPDF